MGNRALIEAMQTYLAKRAPNERQHIFGQIVFTAPDVDRDYFIDAIDSLRGTAERVTLYASDNDHALHYSQFVHGAPRAGTAGGRHHQAGRSRHHRHVGRSGRHPRSQLLCRQFRRDLRYFS